LAAFDSNSSVDSTGSRGVNTSPNPASSVLPNRALSMRLLVPIPIPELVLPEEAVVNIDGRRARTTAGGGLGFTGSSTSVEDRRRPGEDAFKAAAMVLDTIPRSLIDRRARI
jgi:hypothetical protein